MKKIPIDKYNSKIHVKEFKRKCNECGKVWHSLEAREKNLEFNKAVSSLNQFSSASTCNTNSSLQAQRNSNALKDTLEKLKSCPECGSQNYNEEILIYEKK